MRRAVTYQYRRAHDTRFRRPPITA